MAKADTWGINMKKLVAESMNEWKIFGDKKPYVPRPNSNISNSKVTSAENVIVNIFKELGMEDAHISSKELHPGMNDVTGKIFAVHTDRGSYHFEIDKEGNVSYEYDEGMEFGDEADEWSLGNLSHPEKLKSKIKEIII
jgi:hypothetical protein